MQKCSACDKHLFSAQTREDLSCMIIGFDIMCTDKLKRMGGSVIPAVMPSKIFFLNKEAFTTSPDYLCYSRSINTIVLGDKSISRKSNATCDDWAMYFKLTQK